MKTISAEEKVLRLLSKPNARYKFKHLQQLTKLTRAQLNLALANVRAQCPNLTFAKFDKTFYLADTPTWYSLHTDLSQQLPLEGQIGLISDSHLCSVAERLDIVQYAYEEFQRRGITTVLHSGDLTDGSNEYRGHHQFVKVFGSQAQAVYVLKHYPKVPGITTYVIAGN